MERRRNSRLRMIPVVIIMIATVLISVIVYNAMLENEREACWERLKVATESTEDKINVRLNDNLNFLEAVSESFVLTQNLENPKQVGAYLNSVMEQTIFERIDILLPDHRMITQSGMAFEVEGDLTYEELLEKGTHISPRMMNPFSGKEVIYCFTTVKTQGDVIGLLCGTIDCESMGKIFEVHTYGGRSQIFLVDCVDGKYLIDNWHDTLGNIYDLGERKSVDGDEMLDMVSPIINREEGRVAYVSETNGERTYQYYLPVEDFNWELCVAVQEEIVFSHVQDLKNILITVGIVEFVLLVLFMTWNVWVNYSAVKSEERARVLELESIKNETRSKFISGMSHDVRTPINGIVGMLQIIRNHREDQEVVDDCLRKIEISTQYLSTLASDMLDINEIESNKLILSQEPINLRKLMKELKVMAESKAREAKVDCYMDCSGLVHSRVMGSDIHIKRVLMNLISNAIKYSQSAGKTVWVSLEEEKPAGQTQGIYRFIVKDNGIGMTEEFQKKMYNAFEQETVTARSNYQGYGLGLTIVNQLVKRMGGRIELESTKGKGSTFTVILPLELDISEVQEQTEEEQITDLSGLKILLVEDNEFNMEIAEVLLSDAGAKIVTAVNGRIATELYASSSHNFFDLILMDLMMPEMDGCEATKVIRKMQRPDAKTVPIIAMTASVFSEEIQRCKEAGMNEHIAKPLDINKLLSKIAFYGKKSGQN